jgi:hypothetical protein
MEAPDKALVVTFHIDTGIGGSKPALAILTPNTVTSDASLTNMRGLYYQLAAMRISSNGSWLDGLYEFDQNKGLGMIVDMKVPNVEIYQFDTNTTHMVKDNSFTGVVFYSNNTTYGTGPGDNGPGTTNYLPATANGITYIADFGMDRGFTFGCKLRQTAMTAAQYNGKYMLMYLEKERQQNTNGLSTDGVVKGFVILSNTQNELIDVYMYTNGGVTNKADVLIATNIIVDTVPPTYAYYATATNQQNGGGVAVVPSSDMSMALISRTEGSAHDTNQKYYVMFGFAIRDTNN